VLNRPLSGIGRMSWEQVCRNWSITGTTDPPDQFRSGTFTAVNMRCFTL